MQFPYAYALTSILLRDPHGCFSVCISSLVLWPMDIHLFGLPEPSAPEHRGSAMVTSHCTTPRSSLQIACWGNGGNQSLCFLSLRDHAISLPDVQCLKNCYFKWLFFFFLDFCCCFRRKNNLVPFFPFWLKAEVLENWNLAIDYLGKNRQKVLLGYDVVHSCRLHVSQLI